MAMHAATANGHTSAHHEEGMSRGMAGMALFIASEIMLFGGLFAAYFFVRNQAVQNDTWPPSTVEHVAGWELPAILTAGTSSPMQPSSTGTSWTSSGSSCSVPSTSSPSNPATKGDLNGNRSDSETSTRCT